MRLNSNAKINVLRYASKIAVGSVLLILAFSSFGSLLPTPQALAACPAGTTPFKQNSISYCVSKDANGNDVLTREVITCDAQHVLATDPKGQAYCKATVAGVPNNEGDSAYKGTVAQDNLAKSLGGLGDWLVNVLAGIIYLFTVGLGSVIANLAATFLNLAVYISLNSTAYALNFLTTGWEAVRDLANMAFIFILVYIAVTVTISADTHKTQETLVRVIAIALIINFSFFFSRVVIDAGNILAINFYNNIQTTVNTTAQTQAGTFQGKVANATALLGASKDQKDLTAPIMNALGLTDAFNGDAFKNSLGSADPATQFIAFSFIYLCVGVILALLSAIFFTIGIKFISRVVILWIAIIASPVALLAYAIPGAHGKGNGYTQQWFYALAAYSIYPAIFLFLYVFIVTAFANGLAVCTVNGSQAGSILGCIFANHPNNVSGLPFIINLLADIAFRMGFLMIVLYLTLLASDKVAAFGGTFAQNLSSYPNRFLGGLTFGTLGRLGRNTIGRSGLNLSQSGALRGTGLGRTLARVGNASFDARTIPSVGKSKLLENVGTPGGKGGYKKYVEEKIKGFEERAKGLKATDEEKEEIRNEFRGLLDESGKTNREIEERLVREFTASSEAQRRVSEETARSMKRVVELQERVSKGDTKAQIELREAQAEQTSLQATSKLALEKIAAAEKELAAHRKKEDGYIKSQTGDKERVEKYALDLTRRKLSNFWMPSAADLVGAKKARDLVRAKSKREQALDSIKDAMAEEEAKEKPHTPPPAIIPPTSATSAAPPHDDHGGGEHH
jgi:hypothetical protein